jgi:RHS repeat-associated protein
MVHVEPSKTLPAITRAEFLVIEEGFIHLHFLSCSQQYSYFDNLAVRCWKEVVLSAHVTKLIVGAQRRLRDSNPAAQSCGARMYDGATGRWLVPDPAAQFANPYLAMGNNPVSGIDPDGCWSISSFIDNHDYEWQKRNLPLAIKITAPFGTEQRGFGFDASIGIPKNSSIGGRINLGATYYNKNYHNPKGWETRFGAEANLGRFLSVGTMHYASGESSQTTSVIQIGSTKKYFRYENDFMFGLPADNHDRFRTTGGIIKWGTLKVNLNLFTGTPGGPDSNHNPEASAYGIDDGKYVKNHRFGIRNDADYARIYNFNNGFDPDKYRDGVLSFQLGIFRIGRNSEGIRNAFQNQFAHDIILKGETPHFKILDIKPRWIFQIASGNGNSTW